MPPFKHPQKQSTSSDGDAVEYYPDEVVPPSPGKSGKGASKGKGKDKGKQVAAKSAGMKRKIQDEAAQEFPAPISMYDPVSYPADLFQPIPSKLKNR